MTASTLLTDALAQTIEHDYWDRQTRFREAWEYYHGQHSQPIGTAKDVVIVNNAGTIVDIGVDFLFGTGPGGTVIEFDAGDDEQVQTAVDKLWSHNRKNTLLRLLSLNGGVTGHPWIRIVPSKQRGGVPRLVVVDPANVSVAWEPDDYTNVRAVRVEWLTTGRKGVECWREEHIRADDDRSWTIQRYWARHARVNTAEASLLLSARWEPAGEPEHWPHAWCQLQSTQNLPRPNEFWGTSDIEHDVQRINDALNAVSSDARKTLRHFAHPKILAKGFTADDLDGSIGDLWEVPEGANAEVLQLQSDLAASFRLMEWLDAKQWERSAIPKIAAGRAENVGQMSSLALEILYRPLIAKTNTKRDLYGDLLIDVSRFALELMSVSVEADALDLAWPEVLPTSEREAAETAAIITERVGGSRSTQMERLGLDPEVEAERRAEEDSAGLGSDAGLAGLLADLGDDPAPAGGDSLEG